MQIGPRLRAFVFFDIISALIVGVGCFDEANFVCSDVLCVAKGCVCKCRIRGGD